MGEKKKGAEEKKPKETKDAASEEGKKEDAPAKADEKIPPPDDEKKEEKKSDPPKEEQLPTPSPPPHEIVLRVFMHCEGCARKVRRCLIGFEGVEDVTADCKTSKVVVKGEKADPLKVLERVQRKSHRKVELISPIPAAPPSQEKLQEKEVAVQPDDEKKEESPVITVLLGVYMHCEACAQEIKRRIHRMKGVETADPDLKSSNVKVKGVFDPQKLVDYVYKRTGKHAVIIKLEPEKKEEVDKAKESKVEEEKKAGEGEKEEKKEEQVAEKNEEGGASGDSADAVGSSVLEPPTESESRREVGSEDPTRLELRKSEFYYYPQNYQMYPPMYVQEMNAYPPQIFSDENPNACSVM